MEPENIKKIQKQTCFGSLAYCCGIEKPCPARDNAIKELGLTKEDFVELKKRFDMNLAEITE